MANFWLTQQNPYQTDYRLQAPDILLAPQVKPYEMLKPEVVKPPIEKVVTPNPANNIGINFLNDIQPSINTPVQSVTPSENGPFSVNFMANQQPVAPASIPVNTPVEQPAAKAVNRGYVRSTFKGKDDFINQMRPFAIEAGKRLGVNPNIIIAQAAHETGWGRHAPNNNYFGIKGKGGIFTTTEYVNGKPVTITDSFRGYRNMEDSVKGYADFILGNKRYKNAIGLNDPEAYINAIAQAGYATDPNYASRVMSLYKMIPTM